MPLSGKEAPYVHVSTSPNLFTIREIVSSSTAFTSSTASVSSLTRFTKIQALSICFVDQILTNATPLLKSILTTLSKCHSLIFLTLISLPTLSPVMLRLISENVTQLKELHLECTDRLDYCCWDCLQDSAECIVHSPIPRSFSDVRSLSVCLFSYSSSWLSSSHLTDAEPKPLIKEIFADALAPLQKLIRLHLGIFLSDEQFFFWHIQHARQPVPPPFSSSPCPSPIHHTSSIELSYSTDPLGFLLDETPRFHGSSTDSQPFSPQTCSQCQNSPTSADVFLREHYMATVMSRKIVSLERFSISSFFTSLKTQMNMINCASPIHPGVTQKSQNTKHGARSFTIGDEKTIRFHHIGSGI